ncbi:MAG: YkgJ family cysteine cluster protein [Terrimicrobiaceae bacterium]
MTSRRTRPIERDAALAGVQAVYSDLAARPIDRQCSLRTECCHFKRTGLTPFLTKGEALLAAKALRASGRTRIPDRKDGACPLLDPKTSRCLVYEARPFGCRTHFCEAAGGPYSRREVLDLIRRLERIDAQVGGSGARPLPDAVAEGLRMLA